MRFRLAIQLEKIRLARWRSHQAFAVFGVFFGSSLAMPLTSLVTSALLVKR